MKDDFEAQKAENIRKLGERQDLIDLSNHWLVEVCKLNYSYHFTWMGLPIIQFPQDMIAMQEIIWSCKPDLIIETGIARGGSLIYYASLLQLVGEGGRILGIDVDIRPDNRAAIESHPTFGQVTMIEGSSVDPAILEQVCKRASEAERVMVVLDSNHTHNHVLEELRLYSPLVTKGSYLVVFDTVIEDMPGDFFPGRPWGKGNNPRTAVHAFLETSGRFEIDRSIDAKLQITVARDGYLRCVSD